MHLQHCGKSWGIHFPQCLIVTASALLLANQYPSAKYNDQRVQWATTFEYKLLLNFDIQNYCDCPNECNTTKSQTMSQTIFFFFKSTYNKFLPSKRNDFLITDLIQTSILCIALCMQRRRKCIKSIKGPKQLRVSRRVHFPWSKNFGVFTFYNEKKVITPCYNSTATLRPVKYRHTA